MIVNLFCWIKKNRYILNNNPLVNWPFLNMSRLTLTIWPLHFIISWFHKVLILLGSDKLWLSLHEHALVGIRCLLRDGSLWLLCLVWERLTGIQRKSGRGNSYASTILKAWSGIWILFCFRIYGLNFLQELNQMNQEVSPIFYENQFWCISILSPSTRWNVYIQ